MPEGDPNPGAFEPLTPIAQSISAELQRPSPGPVPETAPAPTPPMLASQPAPAPADPNIATAAASPPTPEIIEPPTTPSPLPVAPPPLPADEPAPAPLPAQIQDQAAAPTPRVDPGLKRTSAAAEPSAINPGDDPIFLDDRVSDDSKVVGFTVALANGQPITSRRLKEALRDWKSTSLPADQQVTADQLNQIVPMILDYEIDRILLTQEARHKLLDTDKKLQAFNDFANKRFEEFELPRLLRKFDAKTQKELQAKLEAKGQRIDEYRDKFRDDVLSQEYLREALKARLVRPELPALWAHYRENLQTYQRPAQVTWREIVVKCADDSPAQRIAARKKAEALLGLLRQGQDFAEVARAQSQGPTAPKGGQWITEPGASAVPAVDSALESLPLNQPSTILEGPASFHIVQVESRRPAGPIPFVELQTKILNDLQTAQFQRETEAYLADLRKRSVVITRFRTNKSPRSDPQALRTAGP
jgi:parvulin-like peptidyl-prolyl isomerase